MRTRESLIMDKKTQEELQKKYMEMQMLDVQMKQIHKQLESVEENIGELMQTKNNIESIRGISQGTEILVPISSGIFVKGAIKDTSGLLVNVGANTVVNKSVEETKALLDSQMEEITKYREQMLQVLHKLENKAIELDKQLTGMME